MTRKINRKTTFPEVTLTTGKVHKKLLLFPKAGSYSCMMKDDSFINENKCRITLNLSDGAKLDSEGECHYHIERSHIEIGKLLLNLKVNLDL